MSLKFFTTGGGGSGNPGSGVSFPQKAALNVQQMSVMAWFSTTVLNPNQAASLITKDAPTFFGADATWMLQLERGGDFKIMAFLGASNGDDTFAGTSNFLGNGTWHHMVWTYDPSNAGVNAGAFYLDGVFDSNFSEGAAFTFSYDAGNLFFGFQAGARNNAFGVAIPLDGIMADARLYNRVLSANEIKEIFRGFGADRIINGLVTKTQLVEGSSGVNATVASSIKDISPTLLLGTPTNDAGGSIFPQYAVHPIKTKRRYL